MRRCGSGAGAARVLAETGPVGCREVHRENWWRAGGELTAAAPLSPNLETADGDLEDDDSYGSYFEHYDDEDEGPYYTAAGAAAADGTGHGMSAGGSGFSKEGFREDSRGSSAAEGGKGSAGKGEEAPPYPFSGEGGGHSPD